MRLRIKKRRPGPARRLSALCRLVHPAGSDLLGPLGQHIFSHAAHELDRSHYQMPTSGDAAVGISSISSLTIWGMFIFTALLRSTAKSGPQPIVITGFTAYFLHSRSCTSPEALRLDRMEIVGLLIRLDGKTFGQESVYLLSENVVRFTINADNMNSFDHGQPMHLDC